MKNNILTEIKLAITAVFAGLTAWLGTLAIPVYILVGLNVADYITGLTAAPYRGERRSSAVGIRGIYKKVCMWVLVALGAVLDWLLMYAAETISITLPFHFLVGISVTIWLICNEIISILENIGDIGTEMPGFLMVLVKWVKKATEDKAKIGEGKQHEDMD